MKRTPTLTQSELKKKLVYDPETGIFYRRVSDRHPHLVGKPTGSFIRRTRNGIPKQVSVTIYPWSYGAHRLAWLYMTGMWATEDVDHTNGDPFDNRWCNLRLANRSQNIANSKKRRNAVHSKYKGVTFDVSRNKWMVKVNLIHVGRFDTEEEARLAYDKKAKELFGEFARTNADIHGGS